MTLLQLHKQKVQLESPPKGQSSFRSGLYVDPLDFEREMAYLVKKNYKTASSAEYYKILKSGKNPKQKTVMITFDDGVRNQYTNAYPILKKYGLTGVFFIVSQRSGIMGTQMKEMTANGMEIGSHSAQHQDLMKISDPKVL
ncbi:MAG: putative xylanase/chitin deacetylase, partial [candidate division WS6 bacterium GW2011_GWE1_36_69]